jgi:hypothetical protein
VALVAASSVLDNRHYYPERAFDENPSSAWCEGAPGMGEGSWLEATFPRPARLRSVRLATGWDGRARSHGGDLFYLNARLQTFCLEFDGGLTVSCEVSDEALRAVELSPLDVVTSSVRLRAVRLRPGRDPDFCVSDVAFTGTPGATVSSANPPPGTSVYSDPGSVCRVVAACEAR